jgi:hypothetical protein
MKDINATANGEKADVLHELESCQLSEVTGGYFDLVGAGSCCGRLVLRSLQPPLVSGSSPSGANSALIPQASGGGLGGLTG